MPNTSRMKWPVPAQNVDPWYDGFIDLTGAMDASAYAYREDRNTIGMGGGNFTFNSGTGVLSWAAAIQFLSAPTGFYWQIAAGSITLADGEIFYINLARAPTNNVTLTTQKASNLSAVPDGDAAFVVAIRRGTLVYFCNGATLANGQTSPIFEGGGGGDTCGFVANSVAFAGMDGCLTEDADFTFDAAANRLNVANLTVDPDAQTGGTPNPHFRAQSAAHLNLANAETNHVYFDLSATVQFAGSGTIARQAAWRVARPTYAGVAALTITDAATLYIDGSPAAGLNATLTNSWAIWTDEGRIRHDREALGASLDATVALGMLLVNNTAAGAGAQQYSPMLILEGQGWAVGAGASKEVQFGLQVLPVQDAGSNPTGGLQFFRRIDGSFGSVLAINSVGQVLAEDGALTAPAYTWATDKTTGFWKSLGSAVVNLSLAGVLKAEMVAPDFRWHVPGVGASSNDAAIGMLLINTTAATVGAQKFSPMLVFEGQGWKTNATAESREVQCGIQLVPVQGAADPSAELRFFMNINDAGFDDFFIFKWDTGTAAAQLLASSGSAGVPTYAFGGDPTSGMYTDEGVALDLSFAGVLRWEINASSTMYRNSIGAVTTDAAMGVRLENSTAAAAGAQQYSPMLVWEGQGWKTDATAATREVRFAAQVIPVQGAAAPTGLWSLFSNIAAGGYTEQLRIDTAFASNETGLFVRYNAGAGVTFQRVSVGVADSGGTGFRLIRVPNN